MHVLQFTTKLNIICYRGCSVTNTATEVHGQAVVVRRCSHIKKKSIRPLVAEPLGANGTGRGMHPEEHQRARINQSEYFHYTTFANTV
jgi:hypothetical protein